MILLIIGGLVTWRLAHMLSKENGPLDVFARIRANAAKHQKRSGGWFDMVSCIGCVSVWVGAMTALCFVEDPISWIMYTLAFSAIATILEKIYATAKS